MKQVYPFPAVHSACELLGFDPYYVANEGRFALFVPEPDAEQAVNIIRKYTPGENAALIGKVENLDRSRLYMKTALGSHRALTMLSGEQLPRIC